MNKTNKKQFLHSFKEMDSDLVFDELGKVFPDKESQKDNPLRRLSRVFEFFNKNGDTELLIFNGTDNGEQAYTFVGNKTKKYFDITIIEENNIIKDVYPSENFEIEDKSIKRSRKIEIDQIFILLAKQLDYDIKKAEDMLNRMRCKQAFFEMQHVENTVITRRFYLNWLSKHRNLYNARKVEHNGGIYIYRARFDHIYKSYNIILRYNLQLQRHAVIAMMDYEMMDKIEWAKKYEKLNSKITLPFKEEDLSEDGTNFKFLNQRINTSDFKTLIKFKKIYEAILAVQNSKSNQ